MGSKEANDVYDCSGRLKTGIVTTTYIAGYHYNQSFIDSLEPT